MRNGKSPEYFTRNGVEQLNAMEEIHLMLESYGLPGGDNFRTLMNHPSMPAYIFSNNGHRPDQEVSSERYLAMVRARAPPVMDQMVVDLKQDIAVKSRPYFDRH